MPKITDPDQLVVGTEITIDTTALTFTLAVAGNLSNDGVTLQALYSKFVDLWTTNTYNRFPFPMYAIDARSGQFQFGTDGANFSGWRPANDTTRQFLRDGGWSEFSAAGALQRQYVGVVTLGSVGSGDQLYYQRAAGGSAINFVFTGPVNEGVQVFGDASNGNFDTRTFLKLFARIQAKKYAQAQLSDVGETATGAFKIALALSNEADLKIAASDVTIAANAPYTGITITYLSTANIRGAWAAATTYAVHDVVQGIAANGAANGRWYRCVSPHTSADNGTLEPPNATYWEAWTAANGGGERQIGSSYYAFNRIVAGNSATAEQIYEKIQYQLRQAGDIDAGALTVTGKTADAILSFTGDTLYTSTGVFIDDYASNDINRLVFRDYTGTERTFPFTSAGTINFNPALVGAGGFYRVYFDTLPGAGNDYGESGAVLVQNKDGVDLSGSVGASSIAWTFAYDANVQGGRTAATPAAIKVVAGRPGAGKVTVASHTITRTTGQTIVLTAEQDRVYANP